MNLTTYLNGLFQLLRANPTLLITPWSLCFFIFFTNVEKVTLKFEQIYFIFVIYLLNHARNIPKFIFVKFGAILMNIRKDIYNQIQVSWFLKNCVVSLHHGIFSKIPDISVYVLLFLDGGYHNMSISHKIWCWKYQFLLQIC